MLLDIPSFILSVLFVFSPFLIIFCLYLLFRWFKRDSMIERVFFRVVLGYFVFIVFYTLIPSTINLINPPENQYLLLTMYVDLNSSGTLTAGYWEANLDSFIRYWLQVIINSFLTYIYYPITLLPLIFVSGAVISFFLVLNEIRKSKGDQSMAKALSLLQFGYEENPFTLMHQKLKKPNFEGAWDLFKILIAVLPISLYLLMTILKVTGNQENPNILQGTSLGWFLEVFFVYLATAMFSVHLLYSSRFSFKGDFMGLKLRNAMVQSLITVGTLMSSIAIVLFVIDFSRQFFVVIYFISYFIMDTIYFVLFLDIFEPFSIYILTKMVNYFKKYSASTIGKESQVEILKETKQNEIFVPSVNISELSSNQIEPIQEKEPIPNLVTLDQKESVNKKIEVSESLNKYLLKGSSQLILKSIIVIILLLIFSNIMGILINVVHPEIQSESSVQTIMFISLFIYLCLPLLISTYFFSRTHLKAVLIAIITQSIIVMVDWTLRFALIRWSGSEKFNTLNYVSSYYFIEFYMFVLFLSLSLLLMRRYNWNSFTNVGWIFITGLIMSLAWLLIFKPDFNIILPFTNYNLAKSWNLGSLNLLSPSSTFSSLTDSITQQNEYWVSFVFLNVNVQSTGINLVVTSLTSVPVNLVPFLYIFSQVYKFIQPFTIILLYGLIFYLPNTEFLTVAYKDEDKVEKIVYSERLTPLKLQEILKYPDDYAVSRNFGLGDENEIKAGFTVTQIEESIYKLSIGAQLIQFITEAPISFAELMQDSKFSFEEILYFFDEIYKLKLSKAKPFLIFTKEFGFEYEEANLDSLHVMMVDGRSVFTHNFNEESTVEPALVAGLFSAITSFAKETVKSEQLLRTIDHGDVVLMIEYGHYVFSAIFADKNSVELRSKLVDFVKEFEKKHEEDLSNWLGDTSPFTDDWMLVNQIFDLN